MQCGQMSLGKPISQSPWCACSGSTHRRGSAGVFVKLPLQYLAFLVSFGDCLELVEA